MSTAATAEPAPAPPTVNGPAPTPNLLSPKRGGLHWPSFGTKISPPVKPPDPLSEAERALCNRLKTFTDEHIKPDQQKKKNWSKVKRNATGVPCLAAHSRTITFFDTVKREIQKLLHANAVTMPAPAANPEARRVSPPISPPVSQTYLAAQSPDDWANCEAILTKACASGQGVFQFVSVQQQMAPERRCHVLPISTQLFEHWIPSTRTIGKAPPLVIGGRFQVTGLLAETGFEANFVKVRTEDHFRRELSFIDLENRDKGIQRVPITQIGLPFHNRLLDVAGIHRAEEFFEAHCARIVPQAPVVATQNDPQGAPVAAPIVPQDPHDAERTQMFVSTAGFGRNATLMTFHDLKQRIINREITDEGQIDAALEAAIIAGRQQRGYRFVHSEEQVAMLRRALVVLLPQTLVRRPITDNGIVEPPPTRQQAGTELMHVLQHAAAAKMVDYANPNANNAGAPEYEKAHCEQEYDIGENLRLQHVLQKFLKEQPPRISIDQSPIEPILKGCYDRQLATAWAHGNDPAAHTVSNGAAAPAHVPGAPITSGQHEKNKHDWLNESKLGSVINESSDNEPDVNAGNKSLILSLLQHATGAYGDPSHHDMAKILYEDLVVRVRPELEAQNPGQAPTISELHSNPIARNLLVQTINALYGCNLKPHWLTLQRVNDVLVANASNDVDASNIFAEADADEKAERVLIYQSPSPSRFEAVVPKTAVPKNIICFLEHFENETEKEVAKTEENGGPCVNLLERLRQVKEMVKMRMGEKKEKLSKDVAYLPIEGFANTHYPHHGLFEAIGNHHHGAIRTREIYLLEQRFNKQIDKLLIKLERQITPEDHAAITAKKF